jgi:hypothetical protein
MEDNEKAAQNKMPSKGSDGNPGWEDWVRYLPESKDLWRRVFDENLGAYEVYVRGDNILVATGIGHEGDSAIIASIPVLIELTEKILNEIRNGEVETNTYRGLSYLIRTYNKCYAKRKRLGRVSVQRRYPSKPDLGRKKG